MVIFLDFKLVGSVKRSDRQGKGRLIKTFAGHRPRRKRSSINVAPLGRGCLTEYDAALEILAELTSLPEGPERLARVRQLSGSQFLGLLDDCRTQLAQLGLTTTDHPETDPE